jgi:hypothetical protein
VTGFVRLRLPAAAFWAGIELNEPMVARVHNEIKA